MIFVYSLSSVVRIKGHNFSKMLGTINIMQGRSGSQQFQIAFLVYKQAGGLSVYHWYITPLIMGWFEN